MTVSALLDDVGLAADYSNARVISKAFAGCGIRCTFCSFPQNAGEFRILLARYTQAKITLHHRQKRLDGRWNEPFDSIWNKGWKDYSKDQSPTHAEYEADRLRDELKTIWPCDECFTRYNPTSKRKLGYMYREPREKGFVE